MTVIAIFTHSHAVAFSIDTYAASSRLSSGNWVKVSVSETGMHLITDAQLRSWGLEPSRTKVYGYGGNRIPNRLDSNYIDDLPQTPSEYIGGKGVFFHAYGIRTWSKNSVGGFSPKRNPYTDFGYYYLTDSGEDVRLAPEKSGSPEPGADKPAVYMCNLVHEKDLSSPGEIGFLLVGEEFRFNPAQTFRFQLENPADEYEAKMEVSFVGHTQGGKGTLSFSVNGNQLPTTTADSFDPMSGQYNKGRLHNVRKSFSFSGSNLNLEVKLSYAGTLLRANLDYIAISYPRNLVLPATKNLSFSTDQSIAALGGVGAGIRIWDVTNQLDITNIDAAIDGSIASWRSSYGTGVREYAAWEPDGSFPQPTLVETVNPQNIHAKPTPDMVIFTPTLWRNQAERLAQLHRDDPVEPLEVLVLTDKQVYNEFSSGSPDAQAFRKALKMFYDRGLSPDGSSSKLRYALFFGRVTFDPRLITGNVKALGYPMLPAWFTDSGLSDNDSYTTDDLFAFLDDDSGVNFGRDRLRIAVGRIPVVSEKEAKMAVDKINYYMTRMPAGDWKNNVLVFADDQDNGTHMNDAETMVKFMSASDAGGDVFLQKVYSDEFELINNEYPEARTRLFRILDSGVALWIFTGHGSPNGLTHEKVVTFSDLNSLDLRHWPMLYAATCDFVKWDSPNRSGAELLFNNPNGGVIAAISAIRPVFIALNGLLSAALGRSMLGRDNDGRIITIGEGYRRAKNDFRDKEGTLMADENKLRYVLLGDPAMRLVIPSNRVVIDEIAGVPVSAFESETDEPPTLMARQETNVKGRVVDMLNGQTISDFNGMLYLTLYDAEESVTTRGNGGEKGSPVTFNRQGGRLYAGNAVVSNGEFSFNIVMPAEVANNYRPAAFNLYARSNSVANPVEATGVCRSFYVYGEDPEAVPDNNPPVIESIYLNHPTFENGGEVNPNPMLIARVSDDRAINLSTSGVGHTMTISLDNGDRTYGDVVEYFTPFTDGTPGGTINYPLSNLKEGYHTLTLCVWDSGLNSAEATLECYVSPNIAPTIYEVYTDVNPVQDCANFYISHDRPDRQLTVTVEVFNLMGRRLWSATESGRSDMFTTMPITWDLLDTGGRRVPRGIYIYRATVSDSDSGENTSTASRKLAVKGVE